VHTKGSRFAPRSSSRAMRAMPRRPRRTGSSRRTGRWGAFARNRRRSAGRRAALSLRAAADESSGGAAPSPEGVLLEGEERERLLAALNDLREEERLVIACRFFLELSEDETAAALDVRLGTVKSRTSRALAHLRESYG